MAALRSRLARALTVAGLAAFLALIAVAWLAASPPFDPPRPPATATPVITRILPGARPPARLATRAG